MGTNYYAIPKADDALKAEIKKAIDENDFEKARDLMPVKVHIGKGSIGWQFLFNHNDWKYFGKLRNGLDGIDEFLSERKIIDEYGTYIPVEEFWDYVNGKVNYKPDLTYGTIEDGLNYSNSTEFS